jgi:uncharacterized protein (TIGR02271 family)
MTNPQDADAYMGRTAIDSNGDKVGKVGQVYLDDQTGQPAWVTVTTGLFGTKQSFAPLQGAAVEGDDVRLAVPKDLIKDAPNIDDDGHMAESEQQTLFQHYAQYVNGGGYHESAGNGTQDYSQGRDVSGPTTDDAMTRSEERLHVGTEQVETGRARLRKYIVTENVTRTVPVSHEEVRIEREPITEANRDQALSGADLSEEEHEVTLHAERPVVDKETVPVERVRLGTETVTEERQVNEQVRKEQIDETGVTDARP